MAITTLSGALIESNKQESINSQSLRKTVPFSQINLIDTNTIEYQGSRIGISNAGFKSLLKLIGMSQQFANKFEKLFTAEAKAQFINTMKNAMSSNTGRLSNVTLVLNPISKSIVHIGNDESAQISNSQFINVAENLINDHGMDVTRWATDPVTGIVTIDAFNPHAEFAVQGLSEEVFTGGVSFKNSPVTGFQVSPYVNRMWCANGLTTSMAAESYTLHSLKNDNVNEFFTHIQDLRRNNFAPTGFSERVNIANNTPASIQEMQFAHNQIKPFAGDRTEQWIPLQENQNAYHKLGFENISGEQAKQAKSNQSVWSLVNSMTHFSTHGQELIATDMKDYQASRLQVQAGNLLGRKSYAHENSMPMAFDSLRNDGALLN